MARRGYCQTSFPEGPDIPPRDRPEAAARGHDADRLLALLGVGEGEGDLLFGVIDGLYLRGGERAAVDG